MVCELWVWMGGDKWSCAWQWWRARMQRLLSGGNHNLGKVLFNFDKGWPRKLLVIDANGHSMWFAIDVEIVYFLLGRDVDIWDVWYKKISTPGQFHRNRNQSFLVKAACQKSFWAIWSVSAVIARSPFPSYSMSIRLCDGECMGANQVIENQWGAMRVIEMTKDKWGVSLLVPRSVEIWTKGFAGCILAHYWVEKMASVGRRYAPSNCPEI